MCNSENHKSNCYILALRCFLLSLLIIAVFPRLSFAQSDTTSNTVIIRTTTRAFRLQDVRNLFEEARISASLRRGKRLSFEQLSSYPDRYRVLVEQIQARIIATRWKDSISTSDIDNVLSQLNAGISLQQALLDPSKKTETKSQALPIWEQLRSTEVVVRMAIKLELAKRYFVDSLLAKLPADYMLINWFEQTLEVGFEAITVPRVPTSREIDAAVVDLKNDIAQVYGDRPGRFNKPPKILATRIRVPWSQPRTPQTDATVRQRINVLRSKRESGADLTDVLQATGDAFAIRKQGHVTLNANRHPNLATLKKGERSVIVEDERGAGFYEVKMHAPAFTRALGEETVQRELAAELLRERDQLPSAYKQAQAIADMWVAQPHLAATKTKQIQGSRKIPVSRFAPYGSALIPGLGTSEAGSDHLKSLSAHAVSPQPVSIRQNYVVFRVTDWVLPDLGQWWKVAPTYWRDYEPKARRQLLHQWLNKYAPKSTIEMNAEVITKMKL